MLVLRNPLDTDTTPTAGIKTDALLGARGTRAAARRRPCGHAHPDGQAPARAGTCRRRDATPRTAPAPAVEAIRGRETHDEVIK